ncbi:MAG: DUF418 domain-containing protein [Parasphingorhabdus sp.]
MGASQRYLEMDALRGFAVMGILAINIAAFAQPEMAFINPLSSVNQSPLDVASWAVNYTLFDGKLRGLFSLLFGASTALVIERAEASDQSAAKVHFSRMLWLALFGLAHYFFIWFGDILFLYAASGCLLFLMRNWTAERLIRWGVIAYLVGAALVIMGMGSLLFLLNQASQPNASTEVVKELADVYAELGGRPEDAAAETAVYRGSYAEILHYKLTEKWSFPFQNLMLAPIETIPLMMIGMGLYKNGFLLGQMDRNYYYRMGMQMTLVGLLLFVGIAALAYIQEFDMIWMMNMTQAWSMLPRLLMIFGYASLLVLLVQRFSDHPLMHRVAAAGRAAFSNYLGTSILMTFIFYGWGLGLFEQYGRFALHIFVIGTWVLMLLWSKFWLVNFRYGPLEWLWRSLARMKVQPMRHGQ